MPEVGSIKASFILYHHSVAAWTEIDDLSRVGLSVSHATNTRGRERVLALPCSSTAIICIVTLPGARLDNLNSFVSCTNASLYV